MFHLEGKLENAKISVKTVTDTDILTSGFIRYHKVESPAQYFVSTVGLAVVLDNGEARLALEGDGETDYARPFVSRNDQVKPVNELSSVNWMAGISGERYLNEINLPGSHDSGMNNVAHLMDDATSLAGFFAQGFAVSYATTQVRFIDEQLEEGVRRLDIRLNNS